MSKEHEAPIDPKQALRLARAAAVNARDFELQADLMASRGWHGRATSMAILGIEECGKAWYLIVVGTGLMPATTKQLRYFQRSHKCKQIVTVLFELAVPRVLSLSGSIESLELPDRPPTPDQVKADPTILAGLLRLLYQTIDSLDDSFRQEGDLLQETELRAGQIVEGVADQTKQAGLYVDVASDDSTILAPSDMDADTYAAWKSRLHLALQFAGGLAELSDEDLDGVRGVFQMMTADAALMSRVRSESSPPSSAQ